MRMMKFFKVIILLLSVSFFTVSCGKNSYSKHCMCPVRKAT